MTELKQGKTKKKADSSYVYQPYRYFVCVLKCLPSKLIQNMVILDVLHKVLTANRFKQLVKVLVVLIID